MTGRRLWLAVMMQWSMALLFVMLVSGASCRGGGVPSIPSWTSRARKSLSPRRRQRLEQRVKLSSGPSRLALVVLSGRRAHAKQPLPKRSGCGQVAPTACVRRPGARRNAPGDTPVALVLLVHEAKPLKSHAELFLTHLLVPPGRGHEPSYARRHSLQYD